MKIITDDLDHAGKFCESRVSWSKYDPVSDIAIKPLVERLFVGNELFSAESPAKSGWNYLLIVKSSQYSQYDTVNDIFRNNINLPHGILCVAGAGSKFHGFRDRHWVSPAGNIYLTASVTPNCPIPNFGAGFLSLAAVSVVQTIDTIAGLERKAGIKWVNDILIDGAKVCGVLAQAQHEGEAVTSATMGIGLNVLTTPDIEQTPFVPRAASLSDFVDIHEPSLLASAFTALIHNLYDNYAKLLKDGYSGLLDSYRERSLIIGREVEICADLNSPEIQVEHTGIVERIGENLELYIKGAPGSIGRGRLALKL